MLILFTIGISNPFCFSQTGNQLKKRFYVKWVGQIPSLESQKNEISFGHKLIDIVLGNKDVEISKPIAVLGYGTDSIIIADQGNQTLMSFAKRKDNLDHLFSSNNSVYPSLIGICSNINNDILFTDSKLNGVFVYRFINNQITKFTDQLEFQQPTGIAYSKANKETWIVETAAHKIKVFDDLGNLKKEIGGRGTEPGKFNFPTYIWIDEYGTIYIVDSLNYRIQIFNKEGELITIFGEIGNASGYFARPKGIATDSYGNIYIVDALFHTVQIFDKSGNYLYNFGSQGRDQGEFWLPTGIFIDKENFIYVADSYNSRIQIFQLEKDE